MAYTAAIHGVRPIHHHIRHVNLTGVLARDPRYEINYEALWDNELHPTSDGYSLLADEVVKALQEMGVSQPVVA